MGGLPKAVALEAKALGLRVVVVALEPLADDSLKNIADQFKRVSVGRLGEIIRTLKKNGVKEAVMAGKVPKTLLFERPVLPDIRAAKLLLTLKDKSDDSILLAITKELEKDGIRLLRITDFTKGLLAPEGILTEKPPTKAEWESIRFGWRIAKELGRLDIGQTVVVKDTAVMALEAIEGTDEAIRRGGMLAKGGAVVVKVEKPGQDMRFDVPVVGPETLGAMVESKARVLAVEAHKCIFLDREGFLRDAKKAGVTVVGFKG